MYDTNPYQQAAICLFNKRNTFSPFVATTMFYHV